MDHDDHEAPDALEDLRGKLAERDAALEQALASNQSAAARLREVLLASEPALDPALVVGETVADVETSFAAARAMLERLREGVRQEQALRVPAGAPPRGRGSGAMTAFEKIRAGLAGNG